MTVDDIDIKPVTVVPNIDRGGKQWVRPLVICAVCIVLLLLLCIISIVAGSEYDVSIWQVIGSVFGLQNTDVEVLVLLNLPRTIVAILSGAALSVAAVLLQSITKSKLADPSIVGLSSGAYFCIILIATLSPAIVLYAPLIAIVVCFGVFMLVFWLSYDRHGIAKRFVSIGAVVNVMFVVAIITIIIMRGSLSAGNLLLASVGSLGLPHMDIIIMTAVLTGVGLGGSMLLAPTCNVLGLGDRVAQGLGVSVIRSKILIAIVASILTAAGATNIGITAFLGLLAPSIARLLVGKNHFVVVPLAALVGGGIILLSDIVGRIIRLSPSSPTLPVGIVTTIIGGILFLAMFAKREALDEG